MKEGFSIRGHPRKAETEERFSPEAEIKNILKLPSVERKDALVSWKEKFAEQRIALAVLQADMINHVREHPEATKQDLFEIFNQADSKYHFDEEQKKLAEAIIDVYQERHQAIAKVREQYSDDKVFFKVVFGVSPIGTVVCEQGPVMFHFKCTNPVDFARIDNFNKGGTAIIRALIGRITGGSKIGGTAFNEVLIPELRGAVTAEDTTVHFKDAIKVHEEQHQFRRIINEAIARTDPEQESGKEKPSFEMTNEKVLLRECRISIENKIEDEILAQRKGGADRVKTLRSIHTYISDSIGDEINGLREQLAEVHKELEQYGAHKESLQQAQETIQNAIKKIKSKEFLQDISDTTRSAVLAYDTLRSRSELSDEEVTALFDYEPLNQWHKLIDRLTEQKKVDYGSKN